MRRNLQPKYAEAKDKMNGYSVLFTYRLMNLCVKANPVSLLSTVVDLSEGKFNIENVADITQPNEYQLGVYPHEPESIYKIGKAIQIEHPEFKVETPEVVYNDGSKPEDGRKYLLYTMPEINKDRYDLLMNGVDVLYAECKADTDKVYSKILGQMVAAMSGEDLDIINETKSELKDLYDFYDDLDKQYRDNKKKEIEDAYQEYLKKKETADQKKEEDLKAKGSDVMSKLKLNNPLNEN